MRISDWSSDVCSSDLVARQRRSIRWAGIAESILWDDSCTTETCVHGVRENSCGAVGHWQGSSMSIRPLWNPWRSTDPDQPNGVGADALRHVAIGRTPRTDRVGQVVSLLLYAVP